MSDMLSESQVVRVEFEVVLPVGATKAQTLEWISFCLHGSSCSSENPLVDFDLSCDNQPYLTDLRKTRVYEEFDRQEQPDGSTTFRRRKIETQVKG